MKITLKRLLLFIIHVCMLMIYGCGGGGGGQSVTADPSATTTVQTGRVSPMASGLLYQTRTQSGVVASDGGFSYIQGEQVSFTVGGFELASVQADRSVSLLPLESEKATVNVLRLLKAMDADTNLDNGAQVPNTATGTLFSFDLNDDSNVVDKLFLLNPSKKLPQLTDSQSVNILRQAKIARINPAGTYKSFLKTGIVNPEDGSYLAPSECSPATVKPQSGSVILSNVAQWETFAVTGYATLNMSDGSVARFDFTKRNGNVTLNGAVVQYELGPVKNGSTRAIALLTQNAASDFCSKSLLYLRDTSQPNQPPIARLSSMGSIKFPIDFGLPYTFNFVSEIAPGPDVYGLGSQDRDGFVVSQRWSSSKGQVGTDTSFTEQVAPNEIVTFTLTVTDDEGLSSTKTWTIGNIARTAEDATKFVIQGGGLYMAANAEDTIHVFYKFDQTNNRLYQFECDVPSQHCKRTIFNYDLAGAGLRNMLENFRFLVPGYIQYGDSALRFNIAKELPWGYTPDGEFLDVAAAPAISLLTGSYQGSQVVSLSTSAAGSTIYYTLDGNAPTTASAKYATPLTISNSVTLKAIAVVGGFKNSSVSQADYTITAFPAAAAPVFSLASGNYVGAQTLTMSSTTAGASIYYTRDGSNPTKNSDKYTGDISLQSTMSFRASAIASGYSDSVAAAASYTITQPVPPPAVPLQQADCAAVQVAWQNGHAQCQASYPGGKSGSTVNVVDSRAPATGAASAVCTNGVTSTSGGCSVVPTPPPPPPPRSGLVVTEREYFAWNNLHCTPAFGSKSTQFGVQVKNMTTETVDIRLCYSRGKIRNPECFVYQDVKPGQIEPFATAYPGAGFGPTDFTCQSSGEYTIEWTTPSFPFGRTKNGESQRIEKEVLISQNVVPYVDNGSTLVGGCPRFGAIACTPPTPAPRPPVVAPPTAPPASSETAPDKDGCYIPRHAPECANSRESWSKGDYTLVKIRNNCSARIYGQACILKKDGVASCGAIDAKAGGMSTYWSYNATGKFIFKYTGSTKSDSDWTCDNKEKDPGYAADDIERVIEGR